MFASHVCTTFAGQDQRPESQSYAFIHFEPGVGDGWNEVKNYHYETCLFKYMKILLPKYEHFHLRKSDLFHISAQNIDCGYLQSMFFSRNKKTNETSNYNLCF